MMEQRSINFNGQKRVLRIPPDIDPIVEPLQEDEERLLFIEPANASSRVWGVVKVAAIISTISYFFWRGVEALVRSIL